MPPQNAPESRGKWTNDQEAGVILWQNPTCFTSCLIFTLHADFVLYLMIQSGYLYIRMNTLNYLSTELFNFFLLKWTLGADVPCFFAVAS